MRDHRLGIPPGEIGRVLEPFQRDGNVVGVVGGTGLGLSTVATLDRAERVAHVW